jgi:hypothetical protein
VATGHDWKTGYRAPLATAVLVAALFIGLALYQLFVQSLAGIDLFTARPGGNPLGLVLANAVYDGEPNLVAIILSSAYLFVVALELDPKKRRTVALTYPLVLLLVPFIIDYVYISIGVGRFCKLPCTSDGMSILATTAMGFVLVLSLGGLAVIMREFMYQRVSRIGGLSIALFWMGYLIAFLLLLLGAFLFQERGVVFVHLFGLGLGAICAIPLLAGRKP